MLTINIVSELKLRFHCLYSNMQTLSKDINIKNHQLGHENVGLFLNS